jgi:hypothetical protein
MSRPYDPYIPETIGELIDQLGSMMLSSPTFVDRLGDFPRTIDSEFFVLKKGLMAVRKKIGEERYAQCVEMADRMRAHFEADPHDKTDDSLAGRQLIVDMQALLRGKPPPR